MRRLFCLFGMHKFIQPLWYWTEEDVCKHCYKQRPARKPQSGRAGRA